MDQTIVHAYGVVAAGEPLTHVPPGIADTSVRVFHAGSLAAIISLLPAKGFGVADWERIATNVGERSGNQEDASQNHRLL
jgi:hypothetical protein